MRTRMLPCGRCGREVPIRSKGLCPACRAKELAAEGKARQRRPIKARPRKRDDELSGFFERHVGILKGTRRSMTGAPIPYPSAANVCHLYPKRRYRSVATDDRNVVYLTLEEHTRLDYLLDTMDFDRLSEEFGGTWDTIAGKMALLGPEIRESGKLKNNLMTWLTNRQGKRSY